MSAADLSIPDDLLPPKGCVLRGDDEIQYWLDIMQSKPKNTITPAVKHTAFKILKNEFLLRRARATLDQWIEEGADPFDSESIAHDYLKNIAAMEKAQLAMLRAAGMTFTAIQSSNSNHDTRKQIEATNAENEFSRVVPGFLAVAPFGGSA